MPRRNSPNDIQGLADLSRLSEFVMDKRLGQRSSAKKNRRNRHYDKQFIRNTLAHLPLGESMADITGDTTGDTTGEISGVLAGEPSGREGEGIDPDLAVDSADPFQTGQTQ